MVLVEKGCVFQMIWGLALFLQDDQRLWRVHEVAKPPAISRHQILRFRSFGEITTAKSKQLCVHGDSVGRHRTTNPQLPFSFIEVERKTSSIQSDPAGLEK